MTRIRGFLLASTAGALLATGSMITAGEVLAQQAGQEQVVTQQGQQQVGQQQMGQDQPEIGKGPLPEPQWQFYDHLNPKQGPLAWLPFEEVVGSEVRSQDGQTIGAIIDLVRDRTEGDFYAVVTPAGSQQRAIVPMNHFEVQGDRQIVFAAPEPMESMAAYNEGDYESAMPQQQRQQ